MNTFFKVGTKQFYEDRERERACVCVLDQKRKERFDYNIRFSDCWEK